MTGIYILKSNDPEVKECYVGKTTNLYYRTTALRFHCCSLKSRYYNTGFNRLIRSTGGFHNWSIQLLEVVFDKEKIKERLEYHRKKNNALLCYQR